MIYLLALLIFAAITTAVWFVAVAIYNALFPTPHLVSNSNFAGASAVSLVIVTLISLVPFPVGYLLSLGVWAFASWGVLELRGARAWTLFATLAALSMIARLAVLGVLNF